jgi:membrane associated rhomboid family serine protease
MDRPNWYSEEQEPGLGSRIPPVRTWTLTTQLILGMVVVFVLCLFFPQLRGFLALEREGLANPLHWYQLLTYAFVHSPDDVLHILFNCLMLFWFGRPVEARLGRRRFGLFCAVAAVAGAAAYLLVEALTGGRSGGLIGASGVVVAAMVFFALSWPTTPIIFLVVRMQAWVMVAILLAIDLYFAASYLLHGSVTGTSHFAHLGGALWGWLYFKQGQQLDRLDGVLRGLKKSREQARRRETDDKRQEVDRLLDKINREGLNSLTRAERRFLDSASRDLRNR